MPAAKTRSGRSARTTTVEKSRSDADELIDSLVAGTPESTLAFLEQVATERARAQQFGVFKLWSIRNRCALETQMRNRNASTRRMFAGTKQWTEKLNREVRAEELDKPYYIQGARSFEREVEDDQTGETATRTYVRLTGKIAVYDWTQTVSLDENYIEPDWEVPVSAGDVNTLHQLAKASPVPVVFTDLSGKNEHSLFDGENILVDSTIPVGNQIVALAIQLAHRHIDAPVAVSKFATAAEKLDFTNEAAAAQAAAVVAGWAVARGLGLDADTSGAVTQVAKDYLHHWTKVNPDGSTLELAGIKSRRKRLTARLDDAVKTADAILASYIAAAE